jgi:uncharacterized protein YbjT (DUF2867 family)
VILVTTPNGKVGSNVVAQLLARGAAVRVGAHTVAKAQQAFPQAEVVALDLYDPASVQAALTGVTALYLASPGNAPAEPISRIATLAKDAGVQRIVRLSAAGVEQSDNPLRQIERAIEDSGVAWTFLRPSWFMQNYSTTHRDTIRQQGAFYEPADDARTAFIDARDIAAVAVRALTEDGHAGQAYTLTSGKAHNRHEVAAAISEATGREVRYVPISDEQFRAAMASFNMPADYIELLSSLYSVVRAGWTSATTDVVERVTGQPPIGVEQFARDEREAWLA